MTRIIALVAALGIAVGVLGTLALGNVSEEAGAAPPCPPKCATPSATPPQPQQREDQVTIWSEGIHPGEDTPSFPRTGSYDFLQTAPPVVLDPAKYPGSTTFRIEAILSGATGSVANTFCVRLWDTNTESAVVGSEVCEDFPATSSGPVATKRLRSGTFSLPQGEHDYAVQGLIVLTNGSLAWASSARIIAEWTE